MSLSDEIKRRIDANEDVTVKDGAVTGTPCIFSYGYGKSAPARLVESVDTPTSKVGDESRAGS